jgi:hypothetical protein
MTYAVNVRSLEPLIANRSVGSVNGYICDAAVMQSFSGEQVWVDKNRGYRIAV